MPGALRCGKVNGRGRCHFEPGVADVAHDADDFAQLGLLLVRNA